MEFTKLKHILAVDRTRNFSRAAEEEGITQPALSRSIASFEERYGVRIFERRRGGVFPTSAGAQIIADARVVVQRASTLEENLRLHGRGKTGRISFGLGPLMASLLLPKLAANLLSQHASIQLDCSIKLASILVDELNDHAIEMVVCATQQVQHIEDLEIESIGNVDIGLIVRAHHPLVEQQGSIAFKDALRYPLAGPREIASNRAMKSRRRIICDNYEILSKIVLESDAVWLSSPQMVKDQIRNGTMVQLPLVDPPFGSMDVCVARLAGRTPSPLSRSITGQLGRLLREA